MAVINQPASQIKLTNVSLVRMKKGKKGLRLHAIRIKFRTGG